jgi:DNA-binding transcriptional MerR regulator
MSRGYVTGGFGTMNQHRLIDGQRAFRSKRACELTGITYRQLDYWNRTGFISPSLHEAGGSGSTRYYSAADLRKLSLARRLLDAGFHLERLRDVFATFQEDTLDVGKFVVIMDQRIMVSTGVNWLKNYDFDCVMVFRIKEVIDVLADNE